MSRKTMKIVRLKLKLEYWQNRCDTLEKEIERLQGVQVESTCDQCSTNFLQRKKGRMKRFCSASCRQAHYKTNKEFMRVKRRIFENWTQ